MKPEEHNEMVVKHKHALRNLRLSIRSEKVRVLRRLMPALESRDANRLYVEAAALVADLARHLKKDDPERWRVESFHEELAQEAQWS